MLSKHFNDSYYLFQGILDLEVHFEKPWLKIFTKLFLLMKKSSCLEALANK